MRIRSTNTIHITKSGDELLVNFIICKNVSLQTLSFYYDMTSDINTVEIMEFQRNNDNLSHL